MADISDVVAALWPGSVAASLPATSVREDFPEDLPFARADPLLLEQALINLLDNAVKYSPGGLGDPVAARAMDERIVLTVADEGPGIPAAELPHIFDKFYRARKADLGVAGTGLGLSVARGFVEAFGGTLAAANRSDRSGAIFTLTMPVRKPAERRMNKLAPRPDRRRRAADLRFLRVACRPTAMNVSKRRMRRAPSPCAKEKPDVIVLDLGLPGRDGFAVIEEIRKPALTPIVVLSARDDVAGKVKALELGADDYVTKPFDMVELLARLRAALRHGFRRSAKRPSSAAGP